MNKRDVAVSIFYDKDSNVVLQKRSSISKYGEKYGFWGGGIEGEETPQEAVTRELKEELGYAPKELNFWLKHNFVIKDHEESLAVELYVFLSPITQELLNAKVYEGDGMIKLNIDDAISMGTFSSGDIYVLKKLKEYFDKIK